MLTKLQDNELVAQVQQGQHDAFEELVSRYGGRLYSMGRRICGNDDDAKDMLQETFTAAFKGMNTFRAEAKFSVWLFQIAKHACMRMRRKSKFAPHDTLSLEELAPNEGELSEELCEAIRTHNGHCPPCQAFVETFTKTIELVRKQPAETLPPAVKDELSAALKRCQDALDQAR